MTAPNGSVHNLIFNKFPECFDVTPRTVPFGLVGGKQWFVKVQKNHVTDKDYLDVGIFFTSENEKEVALEVNFYFSVHNASGVHRRFRPRQGKSILVKSRQSHGVDKFMTFDELLKEGSGFVSSEGTVSISVGIRVIAIIDESGVRKHNFFDGNDDSLVLLLNDTRLLYADRQMLLERVPKMAEFLRSEGHLDFEFFENDFIDCTVDDFESFLQIVFNVPLRLTDKQMETIAQLSEYYDFHFPPGQILLA